MEMSGLRVLVADDHERMRDCIVRVLRMEYDVIAAVSDGDELVTAAIDLEPDVIVSDVCMPGVSGTEAQKCLLQEGVEIPFIFVSASPHHMENIARSRGVCIAKTNLLSELNAEVRRAVRLQAARAYMGDLPTRYVTGRSSR